MAEALFNHYAAGTALAASAGTRPAQHVDRTVVEAMKELGLDVRGHRPKMLTPHMVEDADKVVTIGCSADGIFLPLVSSLHWHIGSPEGKAISEVREIRDEIAARARRLVAEIQNERRLQPATAGGIANDSSHSHKGGEPI